MGEDWVEEKKLLAPACSVLFPGRPMVFSRAWYASALCPQFQNFNPGSCLGLSSHVPA